jgi:hypothetical protein
MSDPRAAEIAALLLREGALRTSDPEHSEIRVELLGDGELFEDVRRRLDAVGYKLVERLGHVGVTVSWEVVQTVGDRNRMGLDARHIRLIVYLWTHLVYREWTDLRRDRQTAPPGAEQSQLFEMSHEPEEAAWISYRSVRNELSEVMSAAHFKGVLAGLRRWRFVRYDEHRDRIWADAALYTHIDLERMESFVVDLARRMGTAEDPGSAVTAVVAGSPLRRHEEDGG